MTRACTEGCERGLSSLPVPSAEGPATPWAALEGGTPPLAAGTTGKLLRCSHSSSVRPWLRGGRWELDLGLQRDSRGQALTGWGWGRAVGGAASRSQPLRGMPPVLQIEGRRPWWSDRPGPLCQVWTAEEKARGGSAAAPRHARLLGLVLSQPPGCCGHWPPQSFVPHAVRFFFLVAVSETLPRCSSGR